MRDALRDGSARHEPDDPPRALAPRVDERHLGGDSCEPSPDVLRSGLVELAQAVRRVVELRDDVVEARRRNVREVVLELREGAPHVVRLARLLHDVARRVALEKSVHAPRALVCDDLERLDALGLQELRHAHDVGLEQPLVEDGGVHALQYVARSGRSLDLVRLVDVSAAVAAHVRRICDSRLFEYAFLLFGHGCVASFVFSFRRLLRSWGEGIRRPRARGRWRAPPLGRATDAPRPPGTR